MNRSDFDELIGSFGKSMTMSRLTANLCLGDITFFMFIAVIVEKPCPIPVYWTWVFPGSFDTLYLLRFHGAIC